MFRVSKKRIISAAAIPRIRIGPAGLGMLGLSGLWQSWTTLPFAMSDLITLGVRNSMIRKEAAEIIVP